MVARIPDSNIVYNHQMLEVVHEYKYLGVILDSNLTFVNNTEYIYTKLIKRIGLLGRARNFVSSTTCKYLYDQLILPILDYSDYVYDGCNQYSSFTLQRLQNGAAHRI